MQWEGVDWRFTIAGNVDGGAGCRCFDQPGLPSAPTWVRLRRVSTPEIALKAYTRPALRLANFGYLGHMWELYAMWAWLVLFLQASFAVHLEEPASVVTSGHLYRHRGRWRGRGRTGRSDGGPDRAHGAHHRGNGGERDMRDCHWIFVRRRTVARVLLSPFSGASS